MTRLSWGAAGERFYETGVDRGVLYINREGFAWPGLISVEESPTGGDAKAYYIDGFKYANVASSEEFTATIAAFSSPPQFAPCDGQGVLHTGLIATQQPRKPFSFSYRTKIGNDVDGSDHSYKLHIVYNALASPSNRSHMTISNAAQPQSLSWGVTTLPPAVTGLKPTAHYIVDARTTDPGILIQVEESLYGSDTTEPYLPTPAELMAFFGITILDAGFAPIADTDTILDAGGA